MNLLVNRQDLHLFVTELSMEPLTWYVILHWNKSDAAGNNDVCQLSNFFSKGKEISDRQSMATIYEINRFLRKV